MGLALAAAMAFGLVGLALRDSPDPVPDAGTAGVRLSFRGGGKAFVTPTETNIHGDALCVMVMWPSRRLAVGGWRLAVGGWRLAVGGWRLAAVPGGCP